MSHFKKWLDGEKDLFNSEIEPKPLDEKNYKRIDKVKLQNSITPKEKQKGWNKYWTPVNSLYAEVLRGKMQWCPNSFWNIWKNRIRVQQIKYDRSYLDRLKYRDWEVTGHESIGCNKYCKSI